MQQNSLLWLITTLAIIISGCTTGPPPVQTLSPEAQNIEFRNDVPTDAEYEYVGEVYCNRGGDPFDATPANRHIHWCRDSIRTQAAARSADIVVITSQQVGAGDCHNCVSIFGGAYQRLERPSAVED